MRRVIIYHCQHRASRCSLAVNMDSGGSKNMRNVECRIYSTLLALLVFAPLRTWPVAAESGRGCHFVGLESHLYWGTINPYQKAAFHCCQIVQTAQHDTLKDIVNR